MRDCMTLFSEEAMLVFSHLYAVLMHKHVQRGNHF
jgi:hypothetical protein